MSAAGTALVSGSTGAYGERLRSAADSDWAWSADLLSLELRRAAEPPTSVVGSHARHTSSELHTSVATVSTATVRRAGGAQSWSAYRCRVSAMVSTPALSPIRTITEIA